jgi:hypothetical protein
VSQKVYVTSAEVEAARAIVERNAARGKATADPIRKIANAKLIEVGKQGEGRFRQGLRSPAGMGVDAGAKAAKVIARTGAISPKFRVKLPDDLMKIYKRKSRGRKVSRSSTTTGRHVSNPIRKAKTK